MTKKLDRYVVNRIDWIKGGDRQRIHDLGSWEDGFPSHIADVNIKNLDFVLKALNSQDPEWKRPETFPINPRSILLPYTTKNNLDLRQIFIGYCDKASSGEFRTSLCSLARTPEDAALISLQGYAYVCSFGSHNQYAVPNEDDLDIPKKIQPFVDVCKLRIGSSWSFRASFFDPFEHSEIGTIYKSSYMGLKLFEDRKPDGWYCFSEAEFLASADHLK